MVNFLDNFCSVLEPMLRKVVREEVESGLRRRLPAATSSPPEQPLKLIEAPTTRLHLAFSKNLSLPIFTGTKITDADGNPLQIILRRDGSGAAVPLPYSVKIEMVAVDGDFPGSAETWSSEEFSKKIVKERNGRRPLLAGDVNITMRDGVAAVGEMEFTDNSSWIRSRKFRIAARVVQLHGGDGAGVFIREAVTEAFVVKDHRGELYKKHHPPLLKDAVWRLEKIAKGGVFHTKLASEGIKTVQDFLRLYYVDSGKLKRTLGDGMSDKTWEVTIRHAEECEKGSKVYVYRCQSSNYTLTFNSVCQLLKLDFNGHVHCRNDFKMQNTAYIGSLVKDAYAKWDSLEELDQQFHHSPLLLTQAGEDIEQYRGDGQNALEGNYSDGWGQTSGSFYNHLPIDATTSKTGFSFFSDSDNIPKG